jgi:hypothetical protein
MPGTGLSGHSALCIVFTGTRAHNVKFINSHNEIRHRFYLSIRHKKTFFYYVFPPLKIEKFIANCSGPTNELLVHLTGPR